MKSNQATHENSSEDSNIKQSDINAIRMSKLERSSKDSIHDHLYKDAINHICHIESIEQHAVSKAKEESSVQKISKHSLAIANKKEIEHVKEVIGEMGKKEVMEEAGKKDVMEEAGKKEVTGEAGKKEVCIDRFEEILREMHIIRHHDASETAFMKKCWNLIQDKSYEGIQDFLVKMTKEKEVPEDLVHDLHQLHAVYLAYRPKGLIKEMPDRKELTFRPHLSPLTDTLGAKTHEERLHCLLYSKREQDEKINHLRAQMMQESLRECCFSPEIHSYKGPKVERQLREVKSSEDLELDLCTFNPVLHGVPSPRAPVSPRNFDKAVNRVREATKKREEFKKLIDKIPRGENYERNKNMKPKQFSFFNRVRKEKKIVLYVDVMVAPGKTGRIAICEGDKPKILAKNFCKTYSLDKYTEVTLETMLADQMGLNY